jgi:DsbC/DsbD-like thiol-disulfide interchange protein
MGSILAGPALAMERPYRVSLIGDAYDGASWRTGVLIELEKGWKTYWRMPGEAGIPPEFAWKTSAPAEIEVLFPAPARYEDASGQTVGYEREVIFPVTVTAPGQPAVKLDLSLFFAVCKDICIPAQAEAAIELGTGVRDPEGVARVEEAVKAIPLSGTSITAARVVMQDGKPVLQLELQEKAEDIFVETTTTAYFRSPVFSADGLSASLVIDNVEDLAKLAGTTLKITYTRQGRGLEQSVALP